MSRKFLLLLLSFSLFFSGGIHAEEYVIKKGDTLWDISKKFYDDNFKWPIIWKYNVTINNPDLIYPNQKLNIPILENNFDQIKQKEFKLGLQQEKNTNNNLDDINIVKLTYTLKEIKLNDLTFISDKTPSCTIIASEGAKFYSSVGDLVRIKCNNTVKINTKVVIYHKGEKVDKSNFVFKIAGYGIVKTIENDGTMLVLITKAFDSISKGYFCDKGDELSVKFSNKFKKINTDLSGKVIYLAEDLRYAAQTYNIVIYDKNSQAKVGDIFDIYREFDEDGYTRVAKIGEAQIIYISGDFLTARIIKSDYEIKAGDLVRLTKIALK